MSISLSAAELAQIRADINQLLPDTCAILAVTRTSNGKGGWSESWGTASANVACRVDFTNPGGEQVINASLTPFQDGYLSLPYDTAITQTNRILHNSITYAVTGVNTDGSWLGVKRCIIERVP